MKTPFVVIILLLSGCATISNDTATVTRFADGKVEVVRSEIEKSLASAGYKPMPDGRWQKVTMRERDPVLGLVPISEEPQVAERLSVSYASNERGTLVSILTVAAFKKPFDSGFTEIPVGNHSNVDALLDNAIARARFNPVP